MKAVVVWLSLLWAGLVVSRAVPGVSAVVLLLPLSAACMLWMRNGTAMLLVGCALLLNWLLQPAGIPWHVVVVSVLGAGMVTRSLLTAARKKQARQDWLFPATLTLCGFAAYLLSVPQQPTGLLRIYGAQFVAAILLSLLVSVSLRIGRAMGMIRHSGDSVY